MTLVKNGGAVEDPWVAVDDETATVPDGPVIVSLDRWRRDRESLARRAAPLGIRLPSVAALDDIADALDHVVLIALDFPAFTDGRPYSTARLLRERHGFKGELRAVGQILRDQAQFMLRCGFDAFELAPHVEVEDWLRGMSDIAVYYQPAADRQSSAAALRHQ